MNLDRRNFVKGALVLGGATAATTMGGLAACSSQTPEATPSTTSGAMTAEQYTEPWSFEIPPEAIDEDSITQTVDADVIVVGCGASGLVTANSAADGGLKVVIVSASEAPVSRGGSNNAVYSKAMARDGYPKMDIWHIEKEILANCNMVDQKKWYKYYHNSEEATNWIVDIMEGAGYYTALEQPNFIEPTNLYGQPVCSHSWVESEDSDDVSLNQTALVNQLADRLKSLDGEIYFQTKAVQLEREDDNTGRVTSVIAQDLQTEEYIRFGGSKAIVLAAGDFSANRDMMYKYCPNYANQISDDIYDGETDYDVGLTPGGLYKGEMHQAALWIGAAWQKNTPNCAMLGKFMGGATINRYQNFLGLIVDRSGERFMNECQSRSLGPLSQSIQMGLETFAIWDMDWLDRLTWYDNNYSDQYKEQSIKSHETVIAEWDKKVEDGLADKADTLEELVAAAGLPAETLDTIKHYNELCDAGNDTDFFKDPQYMAPVRTAPFYCERNDFTDLRFYTVLGGLRTNINCQVCDAEDEAIPGLYNVGTMIGDLFAGIYTFMLQGGNYGMGCLTYGYLTGKYIVENE